MSLCNSDNGMICWNIPDRKSQDCVNGKIIPECLAKLNNILRREKWKAKQKQRKNVFCYTKRTDQLLFQTSFPQSGLTYGRQVVNPDMQRLAYVFTAVATLAPIGTRPSAHDDVIKWKRFPCYWPFVRGIHWSPVNSPHKGQWRGALMFSLIRAWINGWANSREAGDLRRHRAHYDVTVMIQHDEWTMTMMSWQSHYATCISCNSN